jgi:hypothetical protein
MTQHWEPTSRDVILRVIPDGDWFVWLLLDATTHIPLAVGVVGSHIEAWTAAMEWSRAHGYSEAVFLPGRDT